MDKNTQEKLARSLTSEGVEILSYLPYLLQDFYELGTRIDQVIELIDSYVPKNNIKNAVDLGCGKGAISIALAKHLKIKTKGIDLMPEFIKEANRNAKERGVENLCHFIVDDMNSFIDNSKSYDLVVYGAIGDVLGTCQEVLTALKNITNNRRYIIINDSYLKNSSSTVRFKHDYVTVEQWLKAVEESNLKILGEFVTDESEIIEKSRTYIRKRADELTNLHPSKAKLFDGYVKSQVDECYDLEDNLISFTWLLQKR